MFLAALNEVGIYRVSGVTSDVQNLKKLFDKSKTAFTIHSLYNLPSLLLSNFNYLPKLSFCMLCHEIIDDFQPFSIYCIFFFFYVFIFYFVIIYNHIYIYIYTRHQ